jgi:hypothetical protein
MTMHKPGCVTPIVYFVNHRDPAHPEGFVMLAPYTSHPTPEGYTREEAGTLAEVDKLQSRLQEQEIREARVDYEMDESRMSALRERVYDRLVATLKSSATSEYEREFIRLYLKLREEKRDKYRQRWLERTSYLYVREFDSHGRDPAKEEYNPDRMDIKS